MAQLMLAEAMIRTGQAQRALLVQSCAPSRLLDPSDSLSPIFGDMATAVVVGPVSAGRGIEASVSYTHGKNPKTLIASVPGKHWYDDGRAVLHIGDAQQTAAVFLDSVDELKFSVDSVLAKAARTTRDVDFFCIHQGAPWLRELVQDYVGLGAARSVETFARTGYVFGSTLPAALALAEQEGQLAPDDLVILAAGGPGTTFGATVIRWGV
jgi:3-oxoacyl-[acyl-carrier-protein] synthase-3